MADIRINALATTAASTASDDFVAVDGSANGTRKLNAYSPTFGGNLTVSGVTTSAGISNSGALTFTAAIGQVAGSIAKNATYGLTYYGVTGSSNDNTILNASGAVVLSNPAGTTNATLAGNLTVNGGTTTLTDGVNYTGKIQSGGSGVMAITTTSGTNAVTLGTAGSGEVLRVASTGLTTLTGNLTVSGTGTSSFGGKIQSSAATATGYNQLYDTTGITTGRGAFAITSTGAGLALGIEASVGGTSFTGSTAYASYFGTTTATPIHFVTNAAISATLTSGGNLGIGTTSPNKSSFSTAVTVNGATNSGFEVAVGDTRIAGFYAASSAAVLNAFANVPLYFSTNNTTRMTLTESGNLGIGTTSPNAKLEIGLGSISGSEPNQYLRVNASTYNSALSANLDLLNWGNNFNSSLGWRISAINSAGVTTQRDLAFSSLVDAGSGTVGAATERMRLFGTGNLFIGASPVDGGQKLQVSGTANLSSGSSANTLSLISTDSTAYSATGYNSAYRVWLYGNGATSAYNFIRFSGGGSNEAAFGTVQNASGRAEFVWQTYDGSAYGERLRIASGGDATFAGKVTSTDAGYTNSGYEITNTTASRTTGWFLNNSGTTVLRDVTGAADLLSVDTSGNATFVGSIAIGNTVQTAAAVASTHKVTISIGGVTYYLLATNV